jgi:anaerobic selenocysteine-containing dehydrogenase
MGVEAGGVGSQGARMGGVPFENPDAASATRLAGHPDRLRTPLRRIGPKGDADRWEPISWDLAIGEIADRWQQIIDRYGAAAILPYSLNATLSWLQLGLANHRLWNRMGASGLQRAARDAAATAAVVATYGARWAPEYADIVHSRLIVLWGNNPAATAPHLMPVLREAQRHGAHVVVIDPRRTPTARCADEHLQPRPATDSALALGLMHVLFDEDLHDEAWLEANTVGWRDLQERTQKYPPDRVAAITGVPVGRIVALARRLGTTKPALVTFADGVQRHGNGGQTVRAIISLPAVVGQVGVRGGGLFCLTTDYVQMPAEALGHAMQCPPTPRVVNMNRLGAALTGEVTDPPIMSLFVFATDPMVSAPNTGRVREGLLRPDLFTVVHDLFLTETARYADIVLPATSPLEHHDIHDGYGHRVLRYNKPVIAPMGEAKSNWNVMRLLADAMGYREPWLCQSEQKAIAELFEACRSISPGLDGITLERLRAEGSVPLTLSPERDVPFSDGRFPTPTGKLELRCDALAASGLDPLPEYAAPAEFADRTPDDTRLVMITGAPRQATSSYAVPGLVAKDKPVPWLEINSDDAWRRGIVNGSTVVVSNARGQCRLRAIVTDDVAPGVVVAPKPRGRSARPGVNWTTSDTLADLAGQSTVHSNLVEVRAATVGEIWHGQRK